MTEINLVPIIPKKFLTLNLTRIIENQLEENAKAIKVDFEVTTRTWKERPSFFIKKIPDGRRIYTDNQVYLWVSGGTKPHKISARNAERLAFFATGFRAKTRPRWIGSNKGHNANKDFTRPKSVNHPGTTAREFDTTIKEKWDKEAPRQFLRALRAELRKS
jgi:hypothetical protein